MMTQKNLAAAIFSLSAVAFNASAAMINHVDFPEEFVQAKDKVSSADQEQVTTSAETNK